MKIAFDDVVNVSRYPLDETVFQADCQTALERDGVLVLPSFLTQEAIAAIRTDGEQNEHLAYYTSTDHNVFLKERDHLFADEHVRNRSVSSTKGCIATDQIPAASALHTLYEAAVFREFLCFVLGVSSLHEYADPLASINLHYAGEGQELGWHFDNSSFAITLMIQPAEAGGHFEYVKDVRDANDDSTCYDACTEVLEGESDVQRLSMEAGALVLFRGRNSMHRVTPTEGSRTRMLAVLAYNTEPDIALSESARMTFFGRLA